MTSWSTERTYEAGWTAWCRWADDHERPVRPAHTADVLAFLAQATEQGLSYSTIRIYRSSIAFAHVSENLPSPTHCEAFHLFMVGLSRTPRALARTRAALFDPKLSLTERALLVCAQLAKIKPVLLGQLHWRDVEPSPFGAVLRGSARRTRVPWNRADPGLCAATLLLLLSVGQPAERAVFGTSELQVRQKLLRLASDLQLPPRSSPGRPWC